MASKRIKISDTKRLPCSKGPIDEVKIGHVIWFKDSDDGGSEWYTQVRVDFLCKGKIVASEIASSISEALLKASLMLSDTEKFDFDKLDEISATKCNQIGCSADATIFYRLKSDVCTACCGKRTYGAPISAGYRIFCDAHAYRGVGGLDDCDSNYEQVDGDGQVILNPTPIKKPHDWVSRAQ